MLHWQKSLTAERLKFHDFISYKFFLRMNGDYFRQQKVLGPLGFTSFPAEGSPRRPARSHGSWGTAPMEWTSRTSDTPATAQLAPGQLAAARRRSDTRITNLKLSD